jgi:CO/xanthine dehydrogenase FAD-binding subunit
MTGIGYERPQTLDEAVAILERYGPAARLLAGGTDLLVADHDHALRECVLVDIKRIPELKPTITESNRIVRISSDTVMTDIADDPAVQLNLPALAAAAASVGAVQIRNRATLAGNLCNASPAADTAPPLLAYGGEVVARGPRGIRRIPMAELFRAPGVTALARGELVTAIEIPVPASPAGSAFGRVTRRRGADLATVSVAAVIDASGRTRLGLGAVGPTPLLVTDETGMLADRGIGEERRISMLIGMLGAARPISDVRGGREYRLRMLRVVAQRVLAAAMAQRAAAVAWRSEGGR